MGTGWTTRLKFKINTVNVISQAAEQSVKYFPNKIIAMVG